MLATPIKLTMIQMTREVFRENLIVIGYGVREVEPVPSRVYHDATLEAIQR